MAFTDEEILDLSGTDCTSVEIPNTIKILKMVKCSLTTLPKLPDELVELYCNENDIRELPKLPKSLKKLVCTHNPNLSHTYDALPEGLEFLDFSCNNFKDIGGENTSIPDSVTELGVGKNNISKIYKLPPSLRLFDCSYNNLRLLPELPTCLEELHCQNNNIKELPSLTNMLQVYSGGQFNLAEYLQGINRWGPK